MVTGDNQCKKVHRALDMFDSVWLASAFATLKIRSASVLHPQGGRVFSVSLEEDPDFVICGHFGSSVLLALIWCRDLRVWQWYLPHDGHPVEQGMRGDVSNQAYRAQWSCYLLQGVSCSWRVVGQRQSCQRCWLAGVLRHVVPRSKVAALVALSVVHRSTRMRKLSSSWNVCRRCWNVVWGPWRVGSRSCGSWGI